MTQATDFTIHQLQQQALAALSQCGALAQRVERLETQTQSVRPSADAKLVALAILTIGKAIQESAAWGESRCSFSDDAKTAKDCLQALLDQMKNG